jgi:sugar phosphate isomerase/epimerase
MGCVSIRANWSGYRRGTEKDPEALSDFINRSTGSFAALAEYGAQKNINVIIENHGGPSSHPEALVRLMKAVDNPYFGTLPDFGNFPPDVDKYRAVEMMMPYAKAVSAKCYDFGEDGGETTLDYARLIKIVVDEAGYHSYIGIEYEGDRLSEYDGVKACKKLLVSLM